MLIATACLALLPLVPSDTPDLVVLQDGKEIECRVLYEDEETVVYTKKRKAQEVARSEVASVQSIERSVKEYLDRFDEIDARSVPALLDLAAFCESRELFGEARHLRIRVIGLDPENETAWTELGGVYTERRGWRLKVRGRYLGMDKLRERVADWKNALELPTAHFLIRTDGDPAKALDLAVDIERAYLAFYDLLGPALRMYPFDEVPEINVYASPDDYPAPRNQGDMAWFEVRANTLHVNGAQAQQAPQAAVATLADLLLWNGLRRTVGKVGAVPAWVRDGLGQAFAAAYRRDPGHASWDFGNPIQAHFVTHAGAEKPLSIKEVVAAGFRATDSGSKAGLYAAESYTLLHFLATGEEGAFRPGLAEYLKESFMGKDSISNLEKALGLKSKEIEERWIEHVRGMS